MIDNIVADTIQVSEEGAWEYVARFATGGEHQVQVQITDASGEVLAASQQLTLQVAPPPVRSPVLDLATLPRELTAAL